MLRRLPSRLLPQVLFLLCTASGLLLAPAPPAAALDLRDYLPAGTTYDDAMPTPKSVLGYEVGEWHVRPEQIQRYAETVAAASDRVTLEVTGATHEQRPVMLLTITHPDNHARLEDIRKAHLAIGDPSMPMPSGEDLDALPAVAWLVYSVHGDEASGANAGLPVLYYLAAAQGEEIEALLRETVILIDPQVNPDGGARFATWANMHKGSVLVGDPNHREHVQGWPSGRTNHYWYDLNRDWLLLQHPESRARIATFQRWRPHVLGDYHEMGRASTYFFQPGVAERINPRIPARNQQITHALANFHAAALDAQRRLYYTGETFDDFYPGKGSTYPDLNGAVGVLFEQASARGHLHETPNGPLAFPTAIHNQVLTSLSLLEGVHDQRRELVDYRRWFVSSGLDAARQDGTAAYVFAEPNDPVRVYHLLDLLRRHGLEVHRLQRAVTLGDGRHFEPGEAFIVPVEQVGYRLVKSLFEVQTTFEDDVFYDISTWTLPLAFGVDFGAVPRPAFAAGLLGAAVGAPRFPEPPPVSAAPAVAYAFDWHGYYAPRALHTLLQAGYRARVTTRSFTAATQNGSQRFDFGAIVLPVGLQNGRADALEQLLGELASRDGIEVHALTSGLTPEGVDLGSPSLRPLQLPRVLLVVGPGVSQYAAGELWHLLDHRFSIPVSLVERDRMSGIDLDSYTHILMVDGRYATVSRPIREALKRWLRGGGTLVAMQDAARWVDAVLLNPDPPEPAPFTVPRERMEGEEPKDRAVPNGNLRPRYVDYERDRAAQLISGTILEAHLDLTHPLAFGFSREKLPVFRTDAELLPPSENPYENVGIYAATPRLSGYISAENLERLSGQTAIRARREGRGTVIQLADNPSFRGFWYGTQKLVLNSLFFGPTLKLTSAPETWD